MYQESSQDSNLTAYITLQTETEHQILQIDRIWAKLQRGYPKFLSSLDGEKCAFHLWQKIWILFLLYTILKRNIIFSLVISHMISCLWWHYILECAVDGMPSQIPMPKFLTHPAPQSPTPRAWPQQQKGKFHLICFVSYNRENTHKVWYKNRGIWHGSRNLMIFDLLTSPQGHQFNPRMKSLLAFCSACHPRQFDMPHDHVIKKTFLPPGHPQHLKVPPLGHDPGNRMKIPSDMFCIFHSWEHTQSLV